MNSNVKENKIISCALILIMIPQIVRNRKALTTVFMVTK